MTTFFQSTMRDFAEESKKKARVRQQKIEQKVKDTKLARELQQGVDENGNGEEVCGEVLARVNSNVEEMEEQQG